MYLVFDIGGTHMRLAVGEDGQQFEEPKIVLTPPNFEEAMQLFKSSAEELLHGRSVQKIAGGIAGALNDQKTGLANSPHLPDWVDKPLLEHLEQDFGAKVVLENDAALAGLGEAVHGAGNGYQIVAYLTISTGVGGVRIVDGQIDRNSMGFEPGHQIIQVDGIECPGCRVRGHLEAYVSGTAIEKRFGKSADQITDQATWEKVAKILAIGLNNTVVHWSPEVVVLGGSVMKSLSVGLVERYFGQTMTVFPKLPVIVHAKLQGLGGLYGAMEYLTRVD